MGGRGSPALVYLPHRPDSLKHLLVEHLLVELFLFEALPAKC